MLDKNKSKRWVKVVAWGLAIVFGTSFSFLFMLPTPQATKSNRTAPTAADTNPDTQAQSLVGQGDMAAEANDLAQAISFYEQALSLDEQNQDAKSGLAAAYYGQGTAAQSEDTTAANAAFTKYLEILPDGPKADEIKRLLKSSPVAP